MFTFFKKKKNKKPTAYIQVDKFGSCYIDSRELSQLPEVKKMQQQALEIVSRR
jgi:hypothetical protein